MLNIIFKIIIDLLTPYFITFFNASLTKAYYPRYFKIIKIAILYKNFIKLIYLFNNYRPIALLSTIDIIIKIIII